MKRTKLTRPTLPRRAKNALSLGIVLVIGISLVQSVFFKVRAAQLSDRSLEISDSRINAIGVNYVFSFTLASSQVLGSIELELCTNDPFPQTACTAPPGLDMLSATLASQTGQVGFTIDASSTANKIVLTRSPALAAPGAVSYTFAGITNPSATATYYGRLLTYPTNDASGSPSDKAGIAWATTGAFSVSTEVPQFLEFCTGITISAFDCLTAAGDYINFGNFSTASVSAATSQMVAATNAGYGYNVGVYGLTMTSGTNIIPALAAQTFSAPGNSQFGINARANSSPGLGSDPVGPGVATVDPAYNTPNLYRFQDGDSLISSAGSSDTRKFTITYITNINAGQPSGRYSTTITYICLANF